MGIHLVSYNPIAEHNKDQKIKSCSSIVIAGACVFPHF